MTREHQSRFEGFPSTRTVIDLKDNLLKSLEIGLLSSLLSSFYQVCLSGQLTDWQIFWILTQSKLQIDLFNSILLSYSLTAAFMKFTLSN